MAEALNFLATQRIAVVTGANRGIGLEICRQLASRGVVAILTARDDKKGAEAIDILLKNSTGLSNYVIFHQLDVTDPSSIAQLKDFIKARFGKLDILVNNAALIGLLMDKNPIISQQPTGDPKRVNKAALIGLLMDKDPITGQQPTDDLFLGKIKIVTQTYELAEECIKTNYYGAKMMIQELLSLLQLSDSPRIVNISSMAGLLVAVRNEWAVGVLSDYEKLTEDKVDDVLNEFLKDCKEGLLETKNWAPLLPAYTLSKAAINAYRRILAKRYPSFLINCVCPGYVNTEMSLNCGTLSVKEGAESPVWLALLPNGGPSAKFFRRKEISPF